MSKTISIGVPSFRMLDRLGADAGKYFDVLFDQCDEYIALTELQGDECNSRAFKALKQNIEKRHAEYFGAPGAAA